MRGRRCIWFTSSQTESLARTFVRIALTEERVGPNVFHEAQAKHFKVGPSRMRRHRLFVRERHELADGPANRPGMHFFNWSEEEDVDDVERAQEAESGHAVVQESLQVPLGQHAGEAGNSKTGAHETGAAVDERPDWQKREAHQASK